MLAFLNKYGAMSFLYLVGIAFAGLLLYEMILGQALNQYALYYVSLAILQATHAGGVAQGVETTNDTVNKVATAQYPLSAREQVGPTGPAGPAGPAGPIGPIGGTSGPAS